MYLKYNRGRISAPLNQTDLAKLYKCSPRKINEFMNAKRGASSFAITLERALKTSVEMWVHMQAEYDLWQARHGAT